MAIPQRIRDDAAAAEEELRRLAAGNQPTEPAPNPTPAEPVSLDDRFGAGDHPNAVRDTPPVEGDGSNPIDAAEYAKLKQQFETLQGLHNRDRAKLAEDRTRLDMLERLVAVQQNARETTPPAAPAAPSRPSLISSAEETEFGADLIDVTRRAAKEEISVALHPIFDQLQRLATKVDSLSHTATAAAQSSAQLTANSFNEHMDRLVTDAEGRPDWQLWDQSENRGDTRFVDWLRQTGEDSDEPRLTVLQRAYQNQDAAKCARFFLSFKRTHGLPNGKPDGSAPAKPAVNPADAMIAPSPVAPSTPSANRGTGKKTFKIAAVESHYNEKTKGKWKGREAEWKRIADEMDDAAANNRVTP